MERTEVSLALASSRSNVINADYRNILSPETDLTLPFGLFRPAAIHISSTPLQKINISSETQHTIKIESEAR